MPKPRILVTGSGGFIGSHLCEHLVQKGYAVRAFLHYNNQSQASWLDTSAVKSDLEPFFGDIRDFDSVKRATLGVDQVFHLAALIGIPYSYLSPLAYIKTNVEGTYNVLEAARERNLSRVLVTSTSEVYGTAQYTPIDENHPLQSQSPYSASKTGADQLALSYHKSFALPVTIARPFNTFGPRQSRRALLPTLITQILSRDEIEVGALTPKRDLTFVKDTVNAMELIASEEKFTGKVVNIGSGIEVSVQELISMICELSEKNPRVKVMDERVRPQASEVDRLLCDASLLNSRTGWRSGAPFVERLKETIDWFSRNLQYYQGNGYFR